KPQCGAEFSFHWGSMIRFLFAAKFEISCFANQNASVCNPNGTEIAQILSVLQANKWALIRNKKSLNFFSPLSPLNTSFLPSTPFTSFPPTFLFLPPPPEYHFPPDSSTPPPPIY